MKIFVLEDDPERIKTFKAELKPSHEVTYVTSVLEAMVKWNPPYDVLFLDHDLGGNVFVSTEDPNTGSEFLRRIKADLNRTNITTGIVVHSLNPPGADYMMGILHENYSKKENQSVKMPFNLLKGNLKAL